MNRFDEQLNITVYRVIQESLTNIAKHAKASHVMVKVLLTQRETQAEWLEIQVVDDGEGLSPEFSESQRFGLLGMKERVQAYGGEVRVESSPEKGTSVVATLPVTAKEIAD